VKEVKETLDVIHNEMYKKAKDAADATLKKAATWQEFMAHLNEANRVLTPWCEEAKCEGDVKEKSGIEAKKLAESEVKVQLSGAAKTLCKPLVQDPIAEGEKCFHCGKDAKVRVMWGRSY